jgi:hypothetical protein
MSEGCLEQGEIFKKNILDKDDILIFLFEQITGG